MSKRLFHTVFDESSFNHCLQSGITADDQGFVYLSDKPIKGYATFEVQVPNERLLHDWDEFWLDEDSNEIDFDHEKDPNNPYWMYEGDIPKAYIRLMKVWEIAPYSVGEASNRGHI